MYNNQKLQKRLSLTSGDESTSPPIPRSVTQSPNQETGTNSGSLGSDKSADKIIVVKVSCGIDLMKECIIKTGFSLNF